MLETDFPDDPFLAQDLEAARSAIKLRDSRAEVDAEVAELEALFRKGEAETVKKKAASLLQKHEEPRARELLAWANHTLAELKAIKQDAKRRPRWVLWGVVAAGLLVVSSLAYRLTVRPPASAIEVSPKDLTFEYRNGEGLPAARERVHPCGGRRPR